MSKALSSSLMLSVPSLFLLMSSLFQVEHQLWQAIDSQFPEEEPITHPLEVERLSHQSFAHELTHNFIGRKEPLIHLNRFEQGHLGRLLVVTGEPGEGKSSLLAHFSQSFAMKNPTTFVLTHYVGASVDSIDVRSMLERLCRELRDAFDLDEVIPEDYKELINTFSSFLEQACFKGKVLVIIDALDQLDPTLHQAHSLDWLPSSSVLPCKVIVSCLADSQCASVLSRRGAAHPSRSFFSLCSLRCFLPPLLHFLRVTFRHFHSHAVVTSPTLSLRWT